MPAEVALLWCATRLRNIHPIARALGLSDAFAATVYADEAPRIADPLVTAAALSEVQTLAPNYLTELRDASLEDLRRGPLATRTQAPLLFRLVRHGLLLEFLRLNLELSHGGGDAPNVTQRTTARLREPEIVPDYGTGVSLWDSVGYFQQYLTDLRLAPTVRPPEDPTPNATRYLQDQLRPLRHAVERLAACPSAELERLLTETLDTCSHRLDAWITSLYTERLEQMRDAQAQGCHLGAYAYVENLRRRTTDPVSDGYIHAPSLDHAAAAAVLRNAFSSHREAAGRFAFDLSSARVQKAQSILDPVRAGQSLSEVLGYRVERWLHEADLDRCIHPLRQRYPLVANKRGDSGLRPEEVAARSVVDGLALHRDPPAPGPGSPFEGVDPTSVRDLLHELAVSVDAVEDLLTAEGVYQLVRGGASVASATLDTLTRGTRPPDPDILRSPRSGIAITHRVMLVLGPATGETSVWGPRRDASARAQLDPSLDDYVGETLGDPSRVSCSVRWKPAPGTAVAGVNDAPGVVEVTLQNLELLPLDVLALVDEAAADWHLDVPPGAPPGTPLEGPADELNRRIVAYVVRAIRDAVVLDITHTTLTAGNRSFPQLWEVARTLRDALRHGQPLTPEDLAMPGPSAGSALAPAYGTETAARVAAAAGLMATCGRGLLGEELRASLELAAKFGVPGAFPQPAWLAAGTAEALRARANEVLREVVSRLAKAAAVATPSIVGAVAITDLRDAAIARSAGAPEEVAKALFGAAPVMLRTFAPRDVEGVRTRFSQGRSLGASPAAVRRWFTQAARVREPLHRLRKLSMYCATTPPVSGPRAPRALSFTVAQMSPAPYDRWVALPFGDRAPPLPGTLSIAALLPENMPTTVWSGVRFDEWVELIPNAREVTGIAFHHDDPGAEAAQAILVAVPPVEGVPWDMPTLVDALDETFALAKVRAVDAERLAHVGALVPAIHLADNTHNDTVTTRFTGRLVGDAPATGGGGAAT